MKVSDVYGRVGLTERAVRLYIREGLIQPSQRDGAAVFDKAGIARLEQISVLRRADFSIDQIRRMLENPDEVNAVVSERKSKLIGRGGEAQTLLDALNAAQTFTGVEQLVKAIGGADLSEPDSIRSRFDEPIAGEAEVEQAWQAIDAGERRRKWLRKLLPVCIAAAVLAVVFFIMWFSRWLDEYAEKNKDAWKMPPGFSERMREAEEKQKREGTYPTVLPWN